MWSFKELSHWYWENITLYGWAGIPVNGGGLVSHLHKADTYYTVEGEQSLIGQRRIFMFKFFLPCHKMWTLFHIPFSGLVQEIHEYCQACSSHWDNRVCMTNVLACSLSPFSHVQLFAILWTVARQAPLSIGFSREEYWSGLPRPPAGDLSTSWPRGQTCASAVSCIAGGFFTTEPSEAPYMTIYHYNCI